MRILFSVFFIFFIVGLALVSMCVSSVQMEFELRFMKAINLIDEYSRERQRRDQKSLLKTTGYFTFVFLPNYKGNHTIIILSRDMGDEKKEGVNEGMLKQ